MIFSGSGGIPMPRALAVLIVLGVALVEVLFAPVFSAHDLLNIENYQAYIKLLLWGQTSKPFNIRTIPPVPGDPERARLLKESSAQTYGRPREEVENEIRQRYEAHA